MTKDCIEDSEGIDEDFYHKLINAEERDRLFDKKILVKSKRYNIDGVSYIDSFLENDNLIIKGMDRLHLIGQIFT